MQLTPYNTSYPAYFGYKNAKKFEKLVTLQYAFNTLILFQYFFMQVLCATVGCTRSCRMDPNKLQKPADPMRARKMCRTLRTDGRYTLLEQNDDDDENIALYLRPKRIPRALRLNILSYSKNYLSKSNYCNNFWLTAIQYCIIFL